MKKFTIILLLFCGSCTIAPRVAVNVQSTSNPIVDAKLFATAFQQRAAEYRALCYQAYNIARLRVDQQINTATPLPKAIMTDIDETVLNNSPYQAHQTMKGEDYTPNSWMDWTSKGIADTVPGALQFLQYAASKGIEIFYVTNREEKERMGTLANLKKFNFPNADNAHLLLKQEVSTKDVRKKGIEATHTIIMLIGDNLNDVSNLFEKKYPSERMKVADDLRASFGDKYIILPNPVYGDWESALYHYNHNLNTAQKDSAIRANMNSY